jgi:hypothetical protein
MAALVAATLQMQIASTLAPLISLVVLSGLQS